MGERKVLSKYIPADLLDNPLPKMKKKGGGGGAAGKTKVRLMLPMTIQCNLCGNFGYRGTKYNANKQGTGRDYLGIPIYEFFFRCSGCAGQLSIATDPKNGDYTAEANCQRNFEAKTEAQLAAEAAAAAEAEGRGDDDEDDDAMAALEARTRESKAEMDAMDALEQIRTLNARQSRISVDQVLAQRREAAAADAAQQRAAAAIAAGEIEEEINSEDERLIAQAFAGAKRGPSKYDDDDDDDDDDEDSFDRLIREKQAKKQKTAAATSDAAEAKETNKSAAIPGLSFYGSDSE